jgi:hypothetical protein
LNVLALDHLIDALPDPDMRLRLRESRVKDIGEAEIMAIRLETYKVADAQRQSVNTVQGIASSMPKSENQEIISLLQNIQHMLRGNNQNTPETKKYSGEDRDFHYKPKKWDNKKNHSNKFNRRNDRFKEQSNQGSSNWSQPKRNDSRPQNQNRLNDQASDSRGGSRRPEGTSPRQNGQ